MATEVISVIKPINNKSFPVVEAQDVLMPDGTRLSEFKGSIHSPNKAEVGQFLRVLSIDEDGKILEVEAVNLISHLIPVTQKQYDNIKEQGTTVDNSVYIIVGEEVC